MLPLYVFNTIKSLLSFEKILISNSSVMKHLITLIIFICLLSPVLKAQMWTDPFPTKNSYGRNNLRLNDIDGSPYLNHQYKTGTVTTREGELYKDIPLRYNCYNDVLEFQRDGNSYDLIPKDRVSKAEFGGQIFSYLEYDSGNGNNKAYFEILAEGKAKLCARYIVTFYEREELKGFADAKPARFDDIVETFWISKEGAPASKVLSNKKLLEILNDKKDELQSFMSKQKLSVKKADDVKKIVNYYNTL